MKLRDIWLVFVAAALTPFILWAGFRLTGHAACFDLPPVLVTCAAR